jgi:hypothetical protein
MFQREQPVITVPGMEIATGVPTFFGYLRKIYALL